MKLENAINSSINFIKNHPYGKYLFIFVSIILLVLIYKIHIWLNTESTDNAYIEAEISNISPEINGNISEILIQDNDYVKKGQIIAKIDDLSYNLKDQKVQSTLEGAKHDIEIIEQNIKLAQIDQAKAKEFFEYAETNFNLTKLDFERTTELGKEKFVSKKLLDDAEMNFKKTKNELSQARLNMQSSQEKLNLLEIERLGAIAKLGTITQEKALAKLDLDNTHIRSPIEGKIGNSSIKIGNYVRAGVTLFSVVPSDALYVKANFKETQIAKFQNGMKAKLTFDSMPNAKIIGKIRNISPATGSKFSLLPPSNATGNFTKVVQRVPVIINFTLPDELKGKIIPGMSCIVEIRTNNLPAALDTAS